MKKQKPLDPFYDLWVGAPLQGKADGARYTVGVGIAEYDKDEKRHLRYPIEDAAGVVVARLRLGAIRQRFTRPVPPHH